MAEIPSFESEFALLDVQKGRIKLASYVRKHGPVRVTVEMTLRETFSGNDGTSIEFSADVHSVTNARPTGNAG